MRVLKVTIRSGKVFDFDAENRPLDDYINLIDTCEFLGSDIDAIRCSEIISLEIKDVETEESN